jgi:ABC-type transporter Mla subunit MlaD
VETKVGDAIVTTQLQERATAPHVIAAMDTFRDSAIHLSGTADSLSGTATALTGTATAATATIGTAGTTIAAVQPVLEQARVAEVQVQKSIANLDTSLQTTSLDLDAVLQHTEAITGSAAKVSDHFEKMIDAPKKHTFWGDVKAGWQIIWQVAMLAK